MKNVYIGYVSDSNRLNDDGFEYVSDIDNIKISAKTANESCLKYVIKKLEGKNERLDKIIFLCTPQVKEHKITEYLKNSIEQLAECTIVEIDTHMDLDVYTEIPKILNHIDDSDRLYRINKDGSELTLITQDKNVSAVCLLGDRIKYTKLTSDGKYVDKMYLCDLDGSGKTELRKR